MPTITVKNVPPGLYRRLKASAEAHRRSLDAEALTLLERALALGPPSVERERALMERIRATRASVRRPLTAEEIETSIREDRDDTSR